MCASSARAWRCSSAFGLFFEGVIGLSGDPFLVGSDYLPIALIGVGVLFLLWGVLRGRRTA